MAADLPDQYRKYLDTVVLLHCFPAGDSAGINRDSFINTASGPLKSSYAITIDIADEPGEIAAVATILALKNISIKNIGIVHNREYEGGILRIEFYQEEAIERPGSSHYTKRDHLQSDLFFLIFPLLFPSPHYFLHIDTYEQSKRTATGIQHHIRKTPIASWDK